MFAFPTFMSSGVSSPHPHGFPCGLLKCCYWLQLWIVVLGDYLLWSYGILLVLCSLMWVSALALQTFFYSVLWARFAKCWCCRVVLSWIFVIYWVVGTVLPLNLNSTVFLLCLLRLCFNWLLARSFFVHVALLETQCVTIGTKAGRYVVSVSQLVSNRVLWWGRSAVD